MVFDLFNVLTSGLDSGQNDLGKEQGNHHRMLNHELQHIQQGDNNLLFSQRGGSDNHPSPVGLKKATEEFVPLLNYFFRENTRKFKTGLFKGNCVDRLINHFT